MDYGIVSKAGVWQFDVLKKQVRLLLFSVFVGSTMFAAVIPLLVFSPSFFCMFHGMIEGLSLFTINIKWHVHLNWKKC